MSESMGKVIRINEFGLCEMAVGEKRAAFTLDKLAHYAGEPLRDVGLRVGAHVVFKRDQKGRVASARVVHTDTVGS